MGSVIAAVAAGRKQLPSRAMTSGLLRWIAVLLAGFRGVSLDRVKHDRHNPRLVFVAKAEADRLGFTFLAEEASIG